MASFWSATSPFDQPLTPQNFIFMTPHPAASETATIFAEADMMFVAAATHAAFYGENSFHLLLSFSCC